MKTVINSIIGTAAVLLCAAACDKWTEQSPMEFNYLGIKDKNPELYEAYMQSIREYHATEHQVLIARFDNKAGIPSGRADHVSCLPDSVDYVVLNNVDLITPTTLEEVAAIAETKGIPTLIPIDYDAARKELSLYKKSLEDDENAPEVDDAAWLSDKAKAFTAKATEYGMAGIMVSFEGRNRLGYAEGEKEADAALQEAFFAPIEKWLGDEAGRIFFFQGSPSNLLIEADLISRARYIIIPAESATGISTLDFKVRSSIDKNVPADRFVIGVTAFDVTDETATDGLFSGGISAIEGAARWAVTPCSGYTKLGVCVNHAQFDYYNITNVYSEIGKAVATMNPSPVK